MARTEPFDELSREYDAWFDRFTPVYQSELAALKEVIPTDARGIEIGVGSGRFSTPFGIEEGVEPSEEMARLARERGIRVYESTAEELPLPSNSYDFALMVTTLCFLDDPDRAMDEMLRVIRKDGRIVIGFVDRDSPLGREYEKHKTGNPFYRYATFHSTAEVIDLLSRHRLAVVRTLLAVFGALGEMTEPQDAKTGYGEGAFVLLAAVRKTELTLCHSRTIRLPFAPCCIRVPLVRDSRCGRRVSKGGMRGTERSELITSARCRTPMRSVRSRTTGR